MRTLLTAIACLTLSAAVGADIPPDIAQAFAAVNNASNDQAESEAREQLARLSSRFPAAFSSVILSDADPQTRWMAIYAVRRAGHDKCDEALMTVFNNPKEPQDLRIQIVFCFLESRALSKERLQRFLPGLHILLSERPRRSDLEHVIELTGMAGARSSIPLLVPLLDDKHVHSYTSGDDGKQIPNTISQTAHEALQEITGRTDIPPERTAWDKNK